VTGKTFFFVTSKTESLFLQKKNPRKIAWTVLYRRKRRKGLKEEGTKRRTRRTQKFQRAIEVRGR
jgi:large subunit ribosomal protein L24e